MVVEAQRSNDAGFTTKERELLKSKLNKPLDVKIEDGIEIATGEVVVDVDYDGERYHDPRPYPIEIRFEPDENAIQLPKVFTKDDRIRNFHISNGRTESEEIHVYGDGLMCLDTPQVAAECFSDGFKGDVFYDKFLIKALFWQSFFERHGHEPFESWGHFLAGKLEYYGVKRELDAIRIANDMKKYTSNQEKLDIKKLMSKRKGISRNQVCLCGSGDPIRDCHPDAFTALVTIQKHTRLLTKKQRLHFWHNEFGIEQQVLKRQRL